MFTQDDMPKYEKAYYTLIDRLKSDRYPVGSRMPTEGDLAKQFSMSRVTIRHALDMLVQDGYVESRRGSGYTVLTLSPASDTCITSFTDAMLRAGYEPSSKLISIKNIDINNSPNLIPPTLSGVDVTMISRVRMVNGTPRMLVVTYAPSKLMKNASPIDFPEEGPGQSILRILRKRFKLNWSAACEDISPVSADKKIAKLLNMKEGEPILKLGCTAFDEKGKPVFYEEVYRNDTVSFNLSKQARVSRTQDQGMQI
tara:strand:- start:3048 stop:3812 length:765 start_codon:yes stop_codon:yes gene_type:complete